MSEEDPYVMVPNWPRFQHYGDREPVWIKLYLELRSRDEWRALTLAERGLLVSIWIEYAAANGRIRSSDIPSRVAQKVPRRSLDSLREAGFLRFRASRPLALRARSRRDRERTPPTPPQSGGEKNSSRKGQKVTGWREVRGTHGASVVPDPLGTDPGPR